MHITVEENEKKHTLYLKNINACSRLFKAVQEREFLKFDGKKVSSAREHPEEPCLWRIYENATEIWNQTCR